MFNLINFISNFLFFTNCWIIVKKYIYINYFIMYIFACICKFIFIIVCINYNKLYGMTYGSIIPTRVIDGRGVLDSNSDPPTYILFLSGKLQRTFIDLRDKNCHSSTRIFYTIICKRPSYIWNLCVNTYWNKFQYAFKVFMLFEWSPKHTHNAIGTITGTIGRPDSLCEQSDITDSYSRSITLRLH